VFVLNNATEFEIRASQPIPDTALDRVDNKTV
jgi:hypothetical protein